MAQGPIGEMLERKARLWRPRRVQRPHVAGTTQAQKPAFPVQDAGRALNPVQLGQTQHRVAVDRPGPGAHRQPVQRRIAHRCRHRPPVQDRGQRAAIAQMAREHPAWQRTPRAKDAHQGGKADPVEPIAPQAPRTLGQRQGIGRCHRRVRRMECGIEGRILRQIGGQRGNGLESYQVCRIVQGRQGDAGGDLLQHIGGDPTGRSQPRPTMHHAMRGGGQLPDLDPGLRQPRRHRRAVAIGPDLGDRGFGDLTLALEDLKLQRGRSRVHDQPHQTSAFPKPRTARPASRPMAIRRKSCGSVPKKCRPPSQLPRSVTGSAIAEAQSVSQLTSPASQ